MRYWAYLIAKLVVAAGIVFGLSLLIDRMLPAPTPFMEGGPFPASHAMIYATALMLEALFAIGLVWVIIWDQRYRCRSCLRRLRMPVATGSWPNMFLFGQPRTEYICLYGHGTLKVPEVRITSKTPDWERHGDDIWKELQSFEETKR